MRESALFLLGLLVAVSVDVARLLVCATSCECGHTHARQLRRTIECMVRIYQRGCDRSHWGNTSVDGSLFPVRDGKITSISGNDTIPPAGSNRCQMRYLRNSNFNKKRFAWASIVLNRCISLEIFRDCWWMNDEERGMRYKNKRKRYYKKYVWQIIRDKVTSIRDVNWLGNINIAYNFAVTQYLPI